MGRNVRIEFEEVAGYPQIGTVRVWIEEKEIKESLLKATVLEMLEKV